MRNVAVLLVLGLISIQSASCDVVRLKTCSLERRYARVGLKHRAVEIDEALLHFWEGGEGQTVVLLHGFGASGIWQWPDQAEALARSGYRVVVTDLLWFGGSRDRKRDFSLDRQVQMVLGLLDHLGTAEVNLVGTSYGGLVAYQLAASNPKRVKKLVLADSPGRVYTAEDHAKLLDRFGVEKLSLLLVPSSRSDVRRLLGIAYEEPPYTPGWALDSVLTGMYGSNREEQALLLENVVADMESLKARQEDVIAPTLIIWGKGDMVFPLDVGERLKAHLSENAALVVIDKTRHSPNLERPALFNQAILEFLERE